MRAKKRTNPLIEFRLILKSVVQFYFVQRLTDKQIENKIDAQKFVMRFLFAFLYITYFDNVQNIGLAAVNLWPSQIYCKLQKDGNNGREFNNI